MKRKPNAINSDHVFRLFPQNKGQIPTMKKTVEKTNPNDRSEGN